MSNLRYSHSFCYIFKSFVLRERIKHRSKLQESSSALWRNLKQLWTHLLSHAYRIYFLTLIKTTFLLQQSSSSKSSFIRVKTVLFFKETSLWRLLSCQTRSTSFLTKKQWTKFFAKHSQRLLITCHKSAIVEIFSKN